MERRGRDHGVVAGRRTLPGVSDAVYRLVIRGLRVVVAVLGMRIEIAGAEHLPARGGAVVAANHTGYLDFAVVGHLGLERGRLVRFLAKSGVFEAPLVGRAMRAMRHVPVDREQGAGAARQAMRLAAAGEMVGVFPEATISRSWLVKPLAPGAAAIAISAQVPLVPVVTFGGHRVLTVDRRGSLRRGTPVSVRVGEPLHPGPDDDPHAVTTELASRLAALLDETIEAYPRDGHAGAWWLPERWGGSAPSADVAARLDAEALAQLAARRARRSARWGIWQPPGRR